jgi:MoaA/NifB/PqqE/SkfB family radical SAM enzyme
MPQHRTSRAGRRAAVLVEAKGVDAVDHDLTGELGANRLDQFEYGLGAPICLTWELTYACNLEQAHCLSSSGRRDLRELTTAQCEAVIDELQRMQVFYVNIGAGEPTIRSDFWHLLEYAVDHQAGVKFPTNGVRITLERARFLLSTDYVDVHVSLDGATPRSMTSSVVRVADSGISEVSRICADLDEAVGAFRGRVAGRYRLQS